MKKIFFMSFFLFLPLLFSDEVHADWPTPMEVLETIAPYTGMNPDQLTAAKFYLDKPECASKIMSYTIAQDYSLVGFIGALKTTKLENLKKLGLPNLDKNTCKKYNPVEQAYIFVNTQGDKLLGKAQADFLRKYLEEQIQSGMEELNAQIASIPYAGTILTNWDCGCDAAFDTSFVVEKLADKTVGLVISIVEDVKKEDYGSALEKLVKEFGPKMACEVAADWVGVGNIPIVSDVASKACGYVAGKAVDFVISGAGSIAETIGIIGKDHIPVEEYYTRMFRPEIGKYDYSGVSTILYGKCYTYYEKSNMSTSTAKKACNALRDRYIKDSLGSIEHAAFYSERYSYYLNNYLPAIQSMSTYSNTEFETAMKSLNTSCEKYFSVKYPNLKAYEKAYDNPITPYDPQFCDFSYLIKDARKMAQIALVNSINNKLQPFCKTSSSQNNVILCEAERINSCKDFLPKTCSGGNGSEFPCCKIGKGTDSVWDMNVKYAADIAKNVGGGIYCSTDTKNPLKISCSLEQSYKSCQKKFQYETNKDCSKTKTTNGVVGEVCCAFEPSKLTTINGVSEAKKFVSEQIAKAPGSCSIGGMLQGYSFDPRIIACSKKTLPACQKKFPGNCSKNSAGFVTGVCCEGYVFEGEEWQYDPLTRLKEHIDLAKKVVSESKGDCITANTKNGEKDVFYIMCKSDAGVNMCKQKLDRLANGSCSDKMTVSGFVSAPCCEKQVKKDIADADKKAKNTSVVGKTKTPATTKTTAPPKKSFPQKRIPQRTVSGETKVKITPTLLQTR